MTILLPFTQESTTTTGTGDLLLSGAVASYLTFADDLLDGQETFYVAYNATDRETGIGTYNAGANSITRTTVLNSTNSGSLVNFTTAPNVAGDAPAQLLSLIMQNAGANLTWYVATTGSDSNPGTSALPFATPQRAVDEAVSFDYQGLYYPTINVADGTYALAAPVLMKPLTNLPESATGNIIGNNTTPGNVIISGQAANCDCFVTQGFGAFWYVDGFQTDTDFNALSALESSTLYFGAMNFDDTSGSGGMTLFLVNAYSVLVSDPKFANDTITVITDALYNFISCTNYSGVTFFSTPIVLPSSLTSTSSFFFAQTHSTVIFIFNDWTNFSGVTGPQLNLEVFCELITDTGQLSDIPGDGGVLVADTTSAIASEASGNGTNFGGRISGAPDATSLAVGTWGLFKDTTAGTGLGVSEIYNDNGTPVVLAQAGQPYAYASLRF